MKFLIMVILVTLKTLAMADTPAVHGMLLFGQKETYASHLPMFHSPHDYQVLLKLNLADIPGSQILSSYTKAKAEGETFFTLVPEVMDLTDLLTRRTKTFKAAVYLGHFERGGQNLGSVMVHVEKVVYQNQLNPNSVSENQNYIIFGSNNEYFMAHFIGGRPNFDLIATIDQPKIKAPCPSRLCGKPDRSLPLPMDFHISKFTFPSTGQPKEGEWIQTEEGYETVIQKILYFETGDLSH